MRAAAGAFVLAVFSVSSPSLAQAPQPPAEFRVLAREILAELIGLDTTQRVGTGQAVATLAARLTAAGFPAEDVVVAGPRPERVNLVVRLRGRGTERPILFLAHLDVVEALKQDWSPDLDPFRLTEKDGYFYGRGTTDVKDEATQLVVNLIRFKREGWVPDRDLVVALTADEEDGEDNGVAWLLANRRSLIEAAFCINTDAGGGQIEKGRLVRYSFQTSEKINTGYRLEVVSPGGHSSMPGKDNAIYELAGALSRLAAHDFPARFNDTTRAFFARMADRESGQLADDLRAVAHNPPDAEAVARVSAASPFYNGTMRTTCVATMLEGGHAPNALPQLAAATVNCRLLPDEDRGEVLRTLERVVANPRVAVKYLGGGRQSPASPLDPAVLGIVERLVGATWPGVPVVPAMDPWATDGATLRAAGMPVYGAPAIFYEVDPNRAHGKDERIGVTAFYEGVEFGYRLLKALGASYGYRYRPPEHWGTTSQQLFQDSAAFSPDDPEPRRRSI